MKRSKNIFSNILILVMILLAVAIIGGLIATEIYVWVTYANTPVGEIPAWALFFMFRGGR